jgi:hypothetical protein
MTHFLAPKSKTSFTSSKFCLKDFFCHLNAIPEFANPDFGINDLQLRVRIWGPLYPVHLLVIPIHICTSQSLFSHSYVVNEWLNRHCDVQIDIRIRADELGINDHEIIIFCFLHLCIIKRGYSAVVARSLCMWKAPGSIPGTSKSWNSFFFNLAENLSSWIHN